MVDTVSLVRWNLRYLRIYSNEEFRMLEIVSQFVGYIALVATIVLFLAFYLRQEEIRIENKKEK